MKAARPEPFSVQQNLRFLYGVINFSKIGNNFYFCGNVHKLIIASCHLPLPKYNRAAYLKTLSRKVSDITLPVRILEKSNGAARKILHTAVPIGHWP